jgi:hypothetical protein
MKSKISSIKKVLMGLAIVFILGKTAQASTVRISDLDGLIAVNMTPTLGAAATIAARIGTWDGTSFTMAPLTAAGYFDNDLKELSATVSAADNTGVGINQGVQLALAVYNSPSSTAYSTSVARAVLTDTSWIMPTLVFGTGVTNFQLLSSTTAVFGTYSFNGGNQQIGLIPEPSSASLFGAGALVLWFVRRKRGASI